MDTARHSCSHAPSPPSSPQLSPSLAGKAWLLTTKTCVLLCDFSFFFFTIILIYLFFTHILLQAVALLGEMPSRHVIPDVVCFGAAISALGEVAAGKSTSAWGAKRDTATRVTDSEDQSERGGGAKAVVPTRPHEKAVALIQQMRRDGPR